MKNLKVGMSRKYFIYTSVCACCFAGVYVIGWFIRNDHLWFVEMTASMRDRSGLLIIFLLTIVLCYLFSSLISEVVKK